ncbi:cupin domain-containing protein [Saccharospirillum mangrovi]|uniref:cupin domain-containing protein n=1 Tax=Saccharospirillum mangrovi TaxID=2161747 RepID=UPI000D36AA55|nr:cupin domain-containing protein [Saccharospirillum mangrovi]
MTTIAPQAALVHELGPNRFTALATPTLGSRETSVWIVEIPPDSPATPHQLTHEEVFIVLQGTAEVTLGDQIEQASAGGAIIVPPDTLFQVRNNGTETFKAVCCLPVGGQAKIGDGEPFTPPWAQ